LAEKLDIKPTPKQPHVFAPLVVLITASGLQGEQPLVVKTKVNVWNRGISFQSVAGRLAYKSKKNL